MPWPGQTGRTRQRLDGWTAPRADRRPQLAPLPRALVRVRDLCRAILGIPADIHDYDGLRRLPEFRRRVGDDLVRVF
jgi:hypothetical protein